MNGKRRTRRVFVCDDPTLAGDPDGLLNVAGLGSLCELAGVVIDRTPVTRRAAWTRYALDRVGSAAPIGLGAGSGTSCEAELAGSRFETDPGTTDAYELCERLLSAVPRRSVRGCFTEGFRMAAWLVSRPDLWSAFDEVAIMGGVEPVTWLPNSAFNNLLDPAAAKRFYQGVQEAGTPATLVDSEYALWAKLPKQLWLDAERSTDSWVAAIGLAMRRQWERMWDAVCTGALPPDRTVAWYLDTRCDGARPPLVRDEHGHVRLAGGESITEYVVGAPVYDVLAGAVLLADEPLGALEPHPRFPTFKRLRPDAGMGPDRAVRAQLRIIEAAFGGGV